MCIRDRRRGGEGNEFERQIFNNYPSPHVMQWISYVDDVLRVWNGSEVALKNFLDLLNSLNRPSGLP